MQPSSDSDSASSTRPQRKVAIPSKAYEFVSKNLPTRLGAAPESQTSTTAVVGAASQGSVKKGRHAHPEAVSSPSQSDSASDKPPKKKKPKKGKRKMTDDEALLDLPYEQVASESDREKWLLGMLRLHTGRDYGTAGLSRGDLEVIWVAHSGATLPNRPSAQPVTPPLQRTDSSTVAPDLPLPTSARKQGGAQQLTSTTISKSRRSPWIGGVSPVPSPQRSLRGSQSQPSPRASGSRQSAPGSVRQPPSKLAQSTLPPAESDTELDDLATILSYPRLKNQAPSPRPQVMSNRVKPSVPADDTDDDQQRDVDMVDQPWPENHETDGDDAMDDQHMDGPARDANSEPSRSPSPDTRLDADDDEEEPTEDDPQSQEIHRETLRQRAQRRKFGIATHVVDLMTERLLLRALTENPYADCTPFLTEADEDGNVFQDGTIFDQMVIEEWAYANQKLRNGSQPLELIEEYIVYARHVFTQLRNSVKVGVAGMVELTYELGTNHPAHKVAERVEKLLDDAFHSSDLKPGKGDFHHEILIASIKKTHFDSPRRAIGYQYASYFKRMPFATIALHCATIQFLIASYRSGRQQRKVTLDATVQRNYYEYYLDALEDALLPLNNPQRIRNQQVRMFDQCYLVPELKPKPLKRGPRVYETDSEEEYVSASKVPDHHRSPSPVAGPSNQG